MNYHLFKQDKFFDKYIEDIYELGLESTNVFLVIGNKGDSPFMRSKRDIVYLGNERQHILEELKTIKDSDKLIVSGYTTLISDLILESHISCNVYVNMMGYEFYCDPWECHASWLYDPITYHEFEKTGALRSLRYNVTHENLFTHVWRYLKWPFRKRKLMAKKDIAIARIDYISCEKEEYELLKKLYPSLRAELRYFGFSFNCDEASGLRCKSIDDGTYRILVGNSADPTNNHAEAYKYISGLTTLRDHKLEIYSFLSYGREIGKQLALEYGQKYFGKSFHPITDFIPLDDFLSLMSTIDAVVMYHNRQQALGNVVSAISMGKPVFFKEKNVMYSIFRNKGIKGVYSTEYLKNHPLSLCIHDARENRERNVEILKKYYSDDVRLQNKKNVLMS